MTYFKRSDNFAADCNLAKLIHKVLKPLRKNICSVHLWSDSIIALAWVDTDPQLLKTFVFKGYPKFNNYQKIFNDFTSHRIVILQMQSPVA